MKPFPKSSHLRRKTVPAAAMKLAAGSLLSLFVLTASQAVPALKLADIKLAPGLSLTPTSKADIGIGWSLILRQATGNFIGTASGGLYTAGSVQNQIASGENLAFGYWDGFGIMSTDAANDAFGGTAIGAIDNSQLNYDSWDTTVGFDYNGGTLNGTNADVLIKYTYYGDADLNGKVDQADFIQFLFGKVNPSQASWLNGDFDYNGIIDQADFIQFLAGKAQYTSQGQLLVGDGKGSSASVVPEPGSLGLLMVGALGLLARRRKSNQALN